MSRQGPHVAILGAGPVGLEAALHAASLSLSFTVYERGEVGEYLRAWGHARMFTPWGMNVSPLGRAALSRGGPADGDLLTGREYRGAYLVPLAAHVKVQTQTEVLCVGRGRARFRLLVRGEKGERIDEADAVLDCTGSYATPRPLGEGGIPAVGEAAAREQLAWGLEDILGEREKQYAERNVLVIGAGLSAATSVVQLASLAAKHPGTWTTWAARGPGSTPLKRQMSDPLRERDVLAARANSLATRGEGNVEFRPSSVVESVEAKGKDAFVVRFAGDPVPLEVERVIANVGYRADDRLAEALGEDRQGYFVLGVKAAGSGFLLRQGLDQVREAFAKITSRGGEVSKKRP